MKHLHLLAILLAMPAFAEDVTLQVEQVKPIYMYDLVVTSSATSRHYTFTMKPGACLRGPLEFYDDSGKVIFSLSEGVEYPERCGERKAEQ